MVCSIATAQTSEQGLTNSGVTIGDGYTYLKNLGVIQVNRADMGVSLGVTSTNVQAWSDLMGNQNNWTQFNTTNQPSLITFGTNMFGTPVKCLYFGSNSPNLGSHLRCDSMAPLMTGVDKPFTWIFAGIGNCNGTFTTAAFGWSGATNASGSRMGMKLNNSGTPTQNSFYKACDTNNGAPTFFVAGGTTTNRWFIETVTFDGVNITIWSNLNPAGATPLTQGIKTTLDEYTLGALRNQNGIFSQKGAFGCAWNLFATNCFTGLQVTNVVQDMNQTLNFY